MGINLLLKDQSEISTLDCYFLADMNDTMIVDEKHNTLSLRLYPNQTGDSAQCQTQDSQSYIEYLYTFKKDDYCFGYQVRFVNMSKYLHANQHNYTMTWKAQPRTVEKNYEYEKNLTSIYFMDNMDEVGNLDERKDDKKDFTTPLTWVSFKQQFFTTCLIVKDKPFTSGSLAVSSLDKDEKSILKDCTASLDFEMNNLDKGQYNMSMYVGPNQYKLLKEYDLQLERQVPLGKFFLLRWINRYTIKFRRINSYLMQT